MSKISYKQSGVDIDAGNSLVENIKPFIAKTKRKEVLGGIGSFAGAFELPKGYKNPVLLSGTDGVGTKLKLAIKSKKLGSVGIDLVAMCVNDIICNWGEPLFFLDYYATGKLNVKEASEVIKGIAKGCEISGCALIGGESAEMPGMYQEDDFDLAGFVVGIAEKDELDRAKKIKEKDILIAFPSSGIHQMATHWLENSFLMNSRWILTIQYKIKSLLIFYLLQQEFIQKSLSNLKQN